MLDLEGTERYHTKEEFLNRGIAPYLEHVQDYMRAKRTIPVSLTHSIHGPITFTFTNSLLERFLKEDMEKPYEVAMKYGFRGFSKGGKNGMFYQRAGDEPLMRKTDGLVDICAREIILDLEIPSTELSDLKKVKIVWHNAPRERILGVYNTENHRIIFLGSAHHN